jgi:hypothetical protein
VPAEHGGNEETDRLHRRAKSALTYYSLTVFAFYSFIVLQFYLFSKKMHRRAKSALSFYSFHSLHFLQLYSFTVLFVLEKNASTC